VRPYSGASCFEAQSGLRRPWNFWTPVALDSAGMRRSPDASRNSYTQLLSIILILMLLICEPLKLSGKSG
jgi:hypothetical protein